MIRAAGAFGGLVALALIAPAAAPAATTGSVSLTLTARTEQALKTRGVTVRTTGKATRSGRRFTLPLASGDAGALKTAGTLQLRARKRTVSLSSVRFELGADPRISALLGGRRTTVLKLAVAPDVETAGVRLPRTAVTLGAGAAKAIASRLRVSKLPSGTFGTLAATASFGAPAPSPPPAPQPSAPAGPCRATTAGGTAPSPGSGEPPVKARPSTARNITSATITWHPRESFVQYINSGEGTAVSRGATADPPEVAAGSDASLVYSFHFPFAEGWCDPATGAARIAFTGTVAFKYSAHEIDLRVNDPEVELDGPASRVIFRMTGSGDTDGGNQRSVVETLDVSKAAVSAAAPSFAYERIPGAVPPGAASSVFAGYYLPGDPFGWVSISYTSD
jgi:hypothetical protein